MDKIVESYNEFLNESHDRLRDAMNDSLGSQVWHVIISTYDKTINNNSDIKRLVQDIKHTVDPRNGGKWHGHDKKLEDIITKASRASNFRTDKWFHELFLNIWDEVLKVDNLTYDDDDDMDEATNEVVIIPYIPFSSHASSSPQIQSSPYAIIGIGILVVAGFASLYAADSGYFDQLKSWWKKWKFDRKINRIVERLKDDQDIIDFLQLPESKQRGKWEKLLSGKLTHEEMKYLNGINKKDFANEGIVESYSAFLNEGKDAKRVPFATYLKYLGIDDDSVIKKIKSAYMDREGDKSDHQRRLEITKLIGAGLNNKVYKWFQWDGYLPDNIYKPANEGKTQIDFDKVDMDNDLVYLDMWKDFNTWCKKNKYPAWKHQTNYIKTIAPSYGINISDSDWSKLFKRYTELHNKMYFAMRGDGTGWPWLDGKIKELNK